MNLSLEVLKFSDVEVPKVEATCSYLWNDQKLKLSNTLGQLELLDQHLYRSLDNVE